MRTDYPGAANLRVYHLIAAYLRAENLIEINLRADHLIAAYLRTVYQGAGQLREQCFHNNFG